MPNEIINRVANSKLTTIDLEELYPDENRKVIDIKDWLFQQIVLKEKEFRQYVNDHDWEQYKDTYVALTCSVDAIIPSWAYLLITTKLATLAKKVVVGDADLLENIIFEEVIKKIPVDVYKNKPVIIKGCSNKPIPLSAYTMLIQKLVPVAKNIMFGEACSTVPLYKQNHQT